MCQINTLQAKQEDLQETNITSRIGAAADRFVCTDEFDQAFADADTEVAELFEAYPPPNIEVIPPSSPSPMPPEGPNKLFYHEAEAQES
jgi:hypothetical protein